MSNIRENPVTSQNKETNYTKSAELDEYESSNDGYSDSISDNDIPSTLKLCGENREDAQEINEKLTVHSENGRIFILSDDVEQGGKEINLDDLNIIFLKPSVAASHKAIRLAFIRKVYGLLTMQIFLTTCIGAVFMLTPPVREFIQTNIWMLLLSTATTIAILIPLYLCRKETPVNFTLLTAFTISQAITVGVIVAFYPKIIVLKAFLITVLVLGSLTFYAWLSKYDYSACYSGLFACLLILVAGGTLQVFLWSPIIELLLGFGGALLFCIFIIVDTQFIMQDVSPEEYILATITLYMDILNIFLYILRILAIFRN